MRTPRSHLVPLGTEICPTQHVEVWAFDIMPIEPKRGLGFFNCFFGFAAPHQTARKESVAICITRLQLHGPARCGDGLVVQARHSGRTCQPIRESGMEGRTPLQ